MSTTKLKVSNKKIINTSGLINQISFPSPLETLEIFEVKQLADKEAAYRSLCWQALKKYKIWCRKHHQETDMIEILYGSMEGNMYRHQVEDSIKLYWAIRQHFRKSYQMYLKKVGYYPAPLKQAA